MDFKTEKMDLNGSGFGSLTSTAGIVLDYQPVFQHTQFIVVFMRIYAHYAHTYTYMYMHAHTCTYACQDVQKPWCSAFV